MKLAKILGFLSLLSVCFYTLQAWAGINEISAMRTAVQPDESVRIVLNASNAPEYEFFFLKNPDRFVIDVRKAKIAADFTIPESKGFIKEIRVRNSGNGDVRIVADLNAGAAIKAEKMLAPASTFKWRLYFDIEPLEANGEAVSGKAKNKNNETRKINLKAPKKKPLIVLDPGHGGKDPGAISASGAYEKNITLRMAKELEKKLLETDRYRVLLTRRDDRALALRQRVQIARKAKANLFISIHADSAHNKNAKGLSVYTLSEIASDREAAALADRENKADAIIGVDFSDKTPELASIFIDLARRDSVNNSSLLADYMVAEMRKRVRVLPNAHRFAGFAVLKAPDIPAILIEIGYLSNWEEEANLKRAEYRERLAEAMTKAVESIGLTTNIFDNAD